MMSFLGGIRLCAAVILPLVLCNSGLAKLVVKVDEPKQTGKKAIVKLTMKNTFEQKIESARAQVFLMNDEGRVVAQSARWVIGGTKENPPMLPNGIATYNFVIDMEKPFTKARVNFVRVLLEGGKSVNIKMEVEVEPVN